MYKLIFILCFSTTLFAQRPNHDKIKAFKVAYLTEQLDLTSSEAEKFWPIYNHYNDQIQELRSQERNQIYGKLKNNDVNNLSNDEANALIDNMILIKTQELQLSKELVVELRKVITPQKIIELKKAEKEFNKKLLERLKNRRKGR
ncbi:MAG: sensor of ECF-type sigma factor [Flavobacteriales bacterium]